MNLSPDGAARAALTRCPPGTFRWIIEDDGLRELLVIDAHLMPGELVRYAKMAFSTFVLPTKYAMSVDALIVSMEDEFAWTSGRSLCCCQVCCWAKAFTCSKGCIILMQRKSANCSSIAPKFSVFAINLKEVIAI